MTDVSAKEQESIMAQLCWLQSDHAKSFYTDEYKPIMSKLYGVLISNAEWDTLQNVGVTSRTKEFFIDLFVKETFGQTRKLPQKIIYLAMQVGCVQKCFASEVQECVDALEPSSQSPLDNDLYNEQKQFVDNFKSAMAEAFFITDETATSVCAHAEHMLDDTFL